MRIDYSYKGFYPYGAGQMFIIDHYIPDNFTGNAVEYILANVPNATFKDGFLDLGHGLDLKFVKMNKLF